MVETVDTLIVGGGQAGLAMSAQLRERGVQHLVLERHRIAEAWRTSRWDSLVANGPAWHDRFPAMEFPGIGPDDFATKDDVVAYFEAFARDRDLPVRSGVEVLSAERQGGAFAVGTSDGPMRASNIVAATGPFQVPSFPKIVPETPGLTQIHSNAYRNPSQLADGGVLVIGAGSSGSQIAEELLAAGRDVYLSIGPHDRPPRSYRGRDFVWWLGVLGKWELKRPPQGADHVTIAVSGANGGRTVDFRRFAREGMKLVGMTDQYEDGVLSFSSDLEENITKGDANYLALLDAADAYVELKRLDLPPEPEAHVISANPDCVINPIRELNLTDEGISTIIWATGYTQNFDWLKVDTFDADGNPQHTKGISDQPGVYFLGLPWLSMRGSSFIWGVWVDAKYLAEHIAAAKRQAV